MAKKKKEKRILATLDFETDPFKHGATIKPFCADFYTKENGHQIFWGDDCVDQLIDHILSLKVPHLIYAHNGGKFDFFFLLEKKAIRNPMLVIHGRIVKAKLLGIHEIRDSYAMIPIPLAQYQKLEIDYAKMERAMRELHKSEIITYLQYDCTALYELVENFIARFGLKLTVGATAIGELRKLHPFVNQSHDHDIQYRPFYFGGRVQFFEAGTLQGDFKVYDVNSMYPYAMSEFEHPSGRYYITLKGENELKLFKDHLGEKRYGSVWFMRFIGWNNQALPTRKEDGGLTFEQEYGEFFACSHEIKTAIELGRLRIDQILEVHIPCQHQNFKAYVEKFIAEKIEGKETENKALEIFAKLMLNSAYGKFATDPLRFKEWFIVDCDDDDSYVEFMEWQEEKVKLYGDKVTLEQDLGRYELWTCPNPDEEGFFDVAVAASITSAARATLLKAIHYARRPIYCDTDSLICEEINAVEIHPTKLGAWDFEGSTSEIHVAGKKLYAMELHQLDKKTGKKKIKLASKGAKLTLDDIRDLCAGKSVVWKSEAPNFKMNGDVAYVVREIKNRTNLLT